jgi:hypothetical protein
MWVVTTPEVRNNPCVLVVKHALVELIRAASAELAGEV